MDDLTYLLDGLSAHSRPIVRRQSLHDLCRRLHDEHFLASVTPHADAIVRALASLFDEPAYAHLALVALHNLVRVAPGSASGAPQAAVSLLLTQLASAQTAAAASGSTATSSTSAPSSQSVPLPPSSDAPAACTDALANHSSSTSAYTSRRRQVRFVLVRFELFTAEVLSCFLSRACDQCTTHRR